ncbi:Pkinase-domain-containing protein [Fomitiporia mediterranea MF3/22]|uniref:Pkinase-domain-containing protein n=1 Tax=Fomitiporia mediterranea (strain MF3/22) TaxID=694068 RepID=UPI00044095F3|nr:Pkinase-domain-containing protein [Fomitiporia mediterranea MF3/22]EJD01901.1 Pkinase-domain-containing protein [Fomitiporia mediterranea MF3/22]
MIARWSSDPTLCPQYRTGRTLGSGTYAVVKEAVHIKTDKYYACKVINKKLMEGREYMVRNEIAVLKRVSKGHKNIVTLHDYFETTHNLYLCFDLCTGGELFDRICAKGNYYEADAANLVRTIMGAVDYIHGCGIVHRDLKPENLLFRTKAEDADIMIADFGLSRIMSEDKLQLLTEICGTPGYMAPEIFRKSGHGKPVDIWAMGVITYFLLCGYTPFDRDTQEQEMQAILKGDYAFEPEEFWANVSQTARDFVRTCLSDDPAKRPIAKEALEHPWLASETPHFIADPESPTGGPKDLLPTIQKGFNARKTFRKAVLGMMAMRRMSMLSHGGASKLSPSAQELATNIDKYMQETELEIVDADKEVIHHHNEDDESDTSSHSTPPTSPDDRLSSKPVSVDISATAPPVPPKTDNAPPLSPFVEQMKKTKLNE